MTPKKNLTHYEQEKRMHGFLVQFDRSYTIKE